MVVAGSLLFESLDEVVLLSLLAIECMLLHTLLISESGGLITCSEQVTVGCVVSLTSLLQVVVLVFVDLGEFGSSLLLLEEVMLGSLDLLVCGGVLALFKCVNFSKAINLLLVTAAFFFMFLQLEVSSVDIFPQRVGVVTLGLSLALEPENLCLTTADLFSEGGNLNLHVIVRPRLVVEEVSGIVALLLQPVQGDAVGVLASLELVLLDQLLVLQVAVLGLDCVELVAQGQIVLVTLLDLEDLSLEL